MDTIVPGKDFNLREKQALLRYWTNRIGGQPSAFWKYLEVCFYYPHDDKFLLPTGAFILYNETITCQPRVNE